ncbi:MAG: 2'-deoxycytidine 5'-triphosphate deaminase, partial [Candidatus Altiarchaeota archaeon]|nr:2'-deoxycytidine 5'-triphosphate deaminase [Candidatus Altiarchaeota archaeon]
MARQRKEENIIGALGEAYHRALPSQEIKRFIKEGMIVTGEALPPEQAIKKVMKDERLQPSTYEPMLSDELFIIDDNVKGGAFNPRLGEQIYHTILNLPLNARHRVSITSNGFEIKPGKSYLVKLEDKLFLHKGLEEGWAWATPKSGQGRLFNQNRLLADNMGAHDEV